ncbi:MAG: beta-L-arabinofuranosidase domain-containing protein [Terriglobales bacterium]
MTDWLPATSRRTFLRSAALTFAGAASSKLWLRSASAEALPSAPLEEFGYGDVVLTSELHEKQLQETHSVLMALSDDSLLKPLRKMAGQAAPGEELGGWYLYDPNYDYHTFEAGFAPGCPFGQWVSALARMYAITGSQETREKVLRLNRQYAQTISPDFYTKNRFPAYCYDKLVCGLIDSHRWANDPDAFSILEQTTNTALPNLPGKAIEHGQSWRPGTDISWTWDESYTMPENLFLAYQRGAGQRYLKIAQQYLDDDAYFTPLSEGRNVLAGRHAYSYVNSLSSAMQAYLTLGSEKHLRAAKNGFDMLAAQSFATGAWGPDEQLRAPGSPDLADSLTSTHSSFETPCGAYAHFKLTRYLLRVTRDSRYGDSMEQVMYNTVLGAKSLRTDGSAFYYSDYNFDGHKVYSSHRWPCCSGTLPQVAADYRINTYFRDPQGVYVNLYIPSTLQWTQDGRKVSLMQKTDYPFDEVVRFEVKLSKPAEFAMNFRIPAWTNGADISINGKRRSEPIAAGSFASVRRKWKTGDHVELSLPMSTRLQAIDAQHPDTVALQQGPLVLFAIVKAPGAISRSQLLGVRKIAQTEWQIQTADGPLLMLPFTAIDEEQYSTYLKVG